jgi:hypothetical protein
MDELIAELKHNVRYISERYVQDFNLIDPDAEAIWKYMDSFLKHIGRELGIVSLDLIQKAIERQLDPTPLMETHIILLRECTASVISGINNKLYP